MRLALALLLLCSAAWADPPRDGPAAELYRQACSARHAQVAAQLHPTILPTQDGRSFLAVWKSCPQPRRWIVSLHGTGGFATEDLAVWHRHLKEREVGLVCVQWWLGRGDRTEDYLTPPEIYRNLDPALRQLGVEPGMAMLHGFSRGSTNTYALTAIDAGMGQRYFGLSVAHCGAVNSNYPPLGRWRRGRSATGP